MSALGSRNVSATIDCASLRTRHSAMRRSRRCSSSAIAQVSRVRSRSRRATPRRPRSAARRSRERAAASVSGRDIRFQREHRANLRHRLAGPFAIGLVDHVNIGDFEKAGLQHLNVVAQARHAHDHRRVRDAHDVHFVLPDPDGFDEHELLARRTHQVDARRRRFAQASEFASRRHAANEDAGVVRQIAHAHAISQNRAAGERRGGIDGQYADRRARAGEPPSRAPRPACSSPHLRYRSRRRFARERARRAGIQHLDQRLRAFAAGFDPRQAARERARAIRREWRRPARGRPRGKGSSSPSL